MEETFEQTTPPPPPVPVERKPERGGREVVWQVGATAVLLLAPWVFSAVQWYINGIWPERIAEQHFFYFIPIAILLLGWWVYRCVWWVPLLALPLYIILPVLAFTGGAILSGAFGFSSNVNLNLVIPCSLLFVAILAILRLNEHELPRQVRHFIIATSLLTLNGWVCVSSFPLAR